MGKTKLKLLSSYVDPDVYQDLTDWAEEEDRSLSNLVSRLLAKAVQERSQRKDKQVQ